MDTVKVDIQKLQLLNDRIAQTIDALNQVRMSVHGIQHTGAQWSPFQQVPPYGFAQSPFMGYPQQFAPFPPTPYPSTYGSPFPNGLSHTSPQTVQYTQYNPYTAYTPFTGTPFTGTPFTGTPFTGTPYTNGISHTSWDPTWQSRQTTFPFVQHPYLNTSW